MKSKVFKWLIAFGVIYLAWRVFWLAGDPGVQSVWEYGYNATDEGYYLSGGKDKYLWGYFVNLVTMESFTYGYSSGTHLLSYLTHLVFGLTSWAWRIPFLAMAFAAWMMSFWYLARKSGIRDAMMLCLAFSSVPMMIAYERTASNDVLIGALTVIAYIIGTNRRKLSVILSAATVSLIVLIKPSIWVILPMVMAGILRERKFRWVWLDLVVFVGTAMVCIGVYRLGAALVLMPDAAHAGVSVFELVKRTTSHYPLPDLFNIASHLKGLSAFPRDPSYALLGVCTAFMVVLPGVMFVRNLLQGRFNGHTLLFLMIPTYVAAINVMNTQYTHYFIPALMMLPILVDAAAEELAGAASTEGSLKKMLLPVVVTLVVCMLGIIYMMDAKVSPTVVQQYYSRIYNFPSENVWGFTTVPMIASVVVAVGGICILRGRDNKWWKVPVIGLATFAAASTVFAALPAYRLAPYIKMDPEMYFAPMAMSLTVSALVVMVGLGIREAGWCRRVMAPFAVLAVVVCYLVTPNWRNAAADFIKPPTYHYDEVAGELKKLLPSDAMVLGERTSQMMMSLPIRAVTTTAANSDPIPVIEAILKEQPAAKDKLYALIDSQHAYNIQHYREHEKEYRLRVMKVFKMPSFGSGKPADVYLAKIEVLK